MVSGEHHNYDLLQQGFVEHGKRLTAIEERLSLLEIASAAPAEIRSLRDEILALRAEVKALRAALDG